MKSALGNRYSDEQLALSPVVDYYLSLENRFAHYRTSEEAWAAEDERTDRLHGTSGHERERLIFEERLFAVMLVAGDTLAEEVGRHRGVLHEAFEDALGECAADSGWSSVQLYDVSNSDVEAYEREFDLTLEMFLDLRHECSKYAATYPTLDPAYRDELLARRRDHYMAAVRTWMDSNPHLVVPIEYHEGANKPHEDFLVQACLQAEDPQECAREERVTLPRPRRHGPRRPQRQPRRVDAAHHPPGCPRDSTSGVFGWWRRRGRVQRGGHRRRRQLRV